MSVTYDVSQLNKLTAEFAGAPIRVGAAVAAAVRKAAVQIERDSKAFAPVDTGYLRSSIFTTYDGDGRSTHITATIGPEAFYGDFVENGTSQHAPQHYMYPAFDRGVPTLVSGVTAAAATGLFG